MRRAPMYESASAERLAVAQALLVLEDLAYRSPVWKYGEALETVKRLLAERTMELNTPGCETVAGHKPYSATLAADPS